MLKKWKLERKVREEVGYWRKRALEAENKLSQNER